MLRENGGFLCILASLLMSPVPKTSWGSRGADSNNGGGRGPTEPETEGGILLSLTRWAEVP